MAPSISPTNLPCHTHSGSYSHTKPTLLEKTYRANIIISTYFDKSTNNVCMELIKNRYGPTTERATIKEGIDIIARMLSEIKFEGRNKLFQQSLYIELKEAIENILSKD